MWSLFWQVRTALRLSKANEERYPLILHASLQYLAKSCPAQEILCIFVTWSQFCHGFTSFQSPFICLTFDAGSSRTLI